MTVNAAGIALIKEHEGCRLDAYQDVGGIWTISYGCTGPDIVEGVTITQGQAESMFMRRLTEFDDVVTKACPAATDNQHSAMTSLAWNIGPGNFRASSVARYHNVGQYENAAQSFGLWNRAGGEVLTGLVARRAAEAALYQRGD